MAIFRRGPSPVTGTSNAGGIGKTQKSRMAIASMTGGVRSTIDGRPCSSSWQLAWTSVYRTDRHASVNLVYLSQHGWLLYDAERDLLAIAKFPGCYCSEWTVIIAYNISVLAINYSQSGITVSFLRLCGYIHLPAPSVSVEMKLWGRQLINI